MKVLVTGGAGFIGSHLVDKLIEKGHQVIVVDNLSTGKKENLNKKAKFYKVDILSPKIAQIFKKEKPEVVFHFAAQVDVRKSVENPLKDAKINILGSLNILENCRKNKVKKIIFASSGGAIYGEAEVIPTPETEASKPQSPYGLSKLLVEQYLEFYKKTYDLDYICLRYANIYGPRQNSKNEAGVVAIFIEKLLKNLPPPIFGSGEQTRDFVFVEDAVSAAIKTLNYQGKKTIFNVGTGVETSINELFQLIRENLNKKIEPKFSLARAEDLKRSCLDFTKIKKEMSWQPKYNLKEGLKKTIEWYKKLNFLEKIKG